MAKKVGDIQKGYQVLDDADNVKSLKITHDLNLGFGSYYKRLIYDECDSNDLEVMNRSDENVKEVFTTAQEYLSELSEDQIFRFIPYFKNKVKIIVTTAPTEAKAFQLFEILNDRGRSLEPMDLIKNSFLKTLNVEGKSELQLKEFNENWKSFLSNLDISKKKKISSSSFLKQYILYRHGINLKSENLFDYIKSNPKIFDGTTILDFVDGMNKISREYKKIESKDYSTFNNDQNMYILFEMLSVKQFHPLLMLFYTETDAKKAEILDLVTRLGAAILFSFTQTNYIEKILPNIITRYINERDTDAAFEVLKNDLEACIEEKIELVKNVVETRNFVSQNGKLHSKALLILKYIELYFNENVYIKSAPKGKGITAEHILSQNLDMQNVTLEDLGFSSEKDRKNHIHMLGNLTILFNTDNSSLQNATYKDKKSMFKDSDFILTSTLIEPMSTMVKNGQDTKLYSKINRYEKQYADTNGQWTRSLIIQRGKDIALLLSDILMNKIV